MFSFLKTRPTSQQGQGLIFGKLPDRSEFVRANSNAPVMQAFDHWLQTALDQLHQLPDWEHRYDTLPALDFCYRDGHSNLIGSLIPSQDNHQRRYPFVTSKLLQDPPAIGNQPQPRLDNSLAPVAGEALMRALQHEYSTISAGEPGPRLSHACRQLADTVEMDFVLAHAVVRQFCQQSSVADLVTSLQQQAPDIRFDTFLLNLAFAIDFACRYPDPVFNQLIRLPLPIDKGRRALYAAFWLKAMQAIAGQDQWGGHFVISQHPSHPVLLMAMRDLPSSTLAALASDTPAPIEMNLHETQEAWRAHRGYADMAYAISRLCADPGIRLAALLEFLTETGLQLARSR